MSNPSASPTCSTFKAHPEPDLTLPPPGRSGHPSSNSCNSFPQASSYCPAPSVCSHTTITEMLLKMHQIRLLLCPKSLSGSPLTQSKAEFLPLHGPAVTSPPIVSSTALPLAPSFPTAWLRALLCRAGMLRPRSSRLAVPSAGDTLPQKREQA